MLNKKILAAGVAAAFTFNASAAIDLTATTSQLITVASESIVAGDADAGTTGNTILQTNAASLTTTTPLGFTVPANETYYIRVDLSNGEFESAANGFAASATGTVAHVSGGQDGDNFVIYSITHNAILPSTTLQTFTITDLSIGTATNTLTYSLFAEPGDAVAGLGNANPLFTDSAAITEIKAVSTGDLADAATADTTALVATGFTGFGTSGTASADFETDIGTVDVTQLLTGVTAVEPDGGAVVIGDLVSGNQVVTVTGDVSVGTWSLNTAANCDAASPVALVKAADNQSASSAATDVTSAPLFVCVDNQTTTTGNPDPAVALPRSAYTVTVGSLATNALASIGYDTTAIEIDYVTTFSGYNQRIYIINEGNVAAKYTTTFITEDGVTATAGTGATGTVAANSVKVIKASDFVSFAGGTRGSAVVEIEAATANVRAVTQTVNLSDGTTDTVSLSVQ